jgi:DnaJ-class molecular chaperone
MQPLTIEELLYAFQKACEAVVTMGDSHLSESTKRRAAARDALRSRLATGDAALSKFIQRQTAKHFGAEACSVCHGTGQDPTKHCPECDGTGHVESTKPRRVGSEQSRGPLGLD